MIFDDRFEAGRELAKKLEAFRKEDAVILAIPRGGLEIGNVIAKALKKPLDIVLTKKIGAPGNPEFAIGAVSLSTRVLNPDVSAPKEYIEEETKALREALKKKYETYRGNDEPIGLKGKIAIIVDDGIATGTTMLATIELIRKSSPRSIVVAIPVAPPDSAKKIRDKVDMLVCLSTPDDFYAVGQYYKQFSQVDDEMAIRLLREVNG